MNEYNIGNRDPRSMGKFYTTHVNAMTEEGLHDKSDIAMELAWRDMRISELKMPSCTDTEKVVEEFMSQESKHKYPSTFKAIVELVNQARADQREACAKKAVSKIQSPLMQKVVSNACLNAVEKSDE